MRYVPDVIGQIFVMICIPLGLGNAILQSFQLGRWKIPTLRWMIVTFSGWGIPALVFSQLRWHLLFDDPMGSGFIHYLEFLWIEEQDRTRWDRAKIQEGLTLLDEALTLHDPGPYQVQAAISALHASALTAEATDWRNIAALYDTLAKMTPSAGCRGQPRSGSGNGMGCTRGTADATATRQSSRQLLSISRCARRPAASDKPARGFRRRVSASPRFVQQQRRARLSSAAGGRDAQYS